MTSEDPQTVRRGTDLLLRAVDVIAEAGGEHLCGVLHSAMQKYMIPASEQGRANSARALAEVAEHAAAAGIPVSLEIVNRYESNLINTARDALTHLELIDHPNVHLHLDTYHMNIEESDMASPVLEAGDALRYVHIGESHRGYLGTGSVDFGTFYRPCSGSATAGRSSSSRSPAPWSALRCRTLSGCGGTSGRTPPTSPRTPSARSATRCARSRPCPCTDLH